MPRQTRISLDTSRSVSAVNRRLFGSFVEHMGRCVYTGIFEPEHSTADANGFRQDVLDLIRELGVTTVRYPGGNFVSGYRWEDGIGPAAARPARLDLAWHSIEPNTFGLHEFMSWAAEAGIEPMMAVNLGTRGIAEAIDLLEYANISGGTALSQARVTNGAEKPFDIKIWCLGNEMDGPWQIGHKTADEYGRLAAETARAMRLVQPDLELVVCGSSSSSMPTFARWEATVLEHTYDQVDFISCHAYYEPDGDDMASFLASAVDMDFFIDSVVATADYVGAKLRSTKKINISFDEWNVWYLKRHQAQATPGSWAIAPRVIEDQYSLADAVVVGGLLISLLRHSDRVAAASLAQLVNVIAPIMTEPDGPAWRQATFHPFALTARHARGRGLDLDVQSEMLPTQRYGQVAAVDAVATYDDDSEELVIFLVNRSTHDAQAVDISLTNFSTGSHPAQLIEALGMYGPDVHATNSLEHQDQVTPRPLPGVVLEGSALRLEAPPASWLMLRLTASGPAGTRGTVGP